MTLFQTCAVRNRYLQVASLVLLLVAAVHVWDGGLRRTDLAQYGHDDRQDLDAASLMDRSAWSADTGQRDVSWRGDHPTNLNPTQLALGPSELLSPGEQSCPTDEERDLRGGSASETFESVAHARLNQVSRRRRLPPDVSVVATRFWDGVLEFGNPRRVIRLVGGAEIQDADHVLEAADASFVISDIPDRQHMWPMPTALIRELDGVQSEAGKRWSEPVMQSLTELTSLPHLSDPAAAEILARLQALNREVESSIGLVSDVSEQFRMRRAAYALQRRIDVWNAVNIAAAPHITDQVRSQWEQWSPETLTATANELLDSLPTHPHGEDWLKFLAVEEFTDRMAIPASQQQVNLACFVLHQIAEADLDTQQRAFLKQPAIAAYQEELRRLAARPASYPEFLQQLEQFEAAGSRAAGTGWMRLLNELRWVQTPAYDRVVAAAEMHYRNANLRLSMTEDFANRFLPAVQYARAPVRERLLGADVQGLSDTLTKLHVRFVPNPNTISVRLEANGQMASHTQSTKGPVTLFNDNRSFYVVQKLFTLDSHGVRFGRTRSTATADTSLKGLRTRYDGMPFLGSMVRRVARMKHQETRPLTHRALGDRIALRVKQRLDAQLERQMVEARRRLEQSVIQPLQEMDLNPQSLAMETTEDRLIWRGRLAGESQLAAFTARPQALANSLVSIQLHESALNNYFDQLHLGGREVELRAMIREILDQWELKNTPIPDEIPEGVELVMVPHHPVQVRCDEDRIQFSMAIARLTADDGDHRRTWRNFRVLVNYVPHADRFSCELHRDSIVRLQPLGSERLSGRDQFALRAIFTRVFSKNQPIQIITPALNRDPRLQVLNIDQFVMRDGWIGVSVGESPDARIGQAPHASGIRRR